MKKHFVSKKLMVAFGVFFLATSTIGSISILSFKPASPEGPWWERLECVCWDYVTIGHYHRCQEIVQTSFLCSEQDLGYHTQCQNNETEEPCDVAPE
jgi:hypothetical protein